MTSNQNDAQSILNAIDTAPKTLKDLLKFFVDCIIKANSISPVGWVVYENDKAIVFSIRTVYTVSIGYDIGARKINGVSIMVAEAMLTKQIREQLKILGCRFGGGFKRTGGSREVLVPIDNSENFTQAINIIRPANEKYILNVLKPGKRTSWPKLYNPEIMQYLRNTLNEDIPDPAYYKELPLKRKALKKESPMKTFEKINDYLQSKGYYFTTIQVSSFYTALQTKGFVILSGISGTGKTKLAQLFAEMLPAPTHRKVKILDDVIAITIQPDHVKYHHLVIPKKYLSFFEPPEPNKRVDIDLSFNGKVQKCWMNNYDFPSGTRYLMVGLKGEAIKWFSKNYKAGDTLLLNPDFSDDKLIGFSVINNKEDEGTEEKGSNCLFLSVRPDWRDSKSLLGYYNPLTRHYEMTPFLEFLIEARKSYDLMDGLAWFVILDEMNLARVEYYFADLLSVLESGRDDEGNTRETLRFIYGDVEEGEVPPPSEMSLPPNLYIIGTVNVDETTQSFSPKVLDRAFSLEFVEVNFDRYASSIKGNAVSWDRQEDGKGLLKEFARDKTFVQIDKDKINEFVQSHKRLAENLQSLNLKLQPYNMHFGYRVFDEIMMFLKNAEDNKIETNKAFDLAVLMKVLPKFHGSRGKLEKPLVEVLVWCANRNNSEEEPVKTVLTEPEKGIGSGIWEYPETAKRVLRMMYSLNSTGFASFG